MKSYNPNIQGHYPNVMATTILRRHTRRKWRWERILVMFSVTSLAFLFCILCSYNSIFDNAQPGFTDREKTLLRSAGQRQLLAAPASSSETNSTKSNTSILTRGEYPPPVFSELQLKSGAVLLYVMGMMYTFVALAIVCDEFFVPALEVIIDKLQICEDVAGATFMAAGGSAPELFTSFIAVFAAHSDVGIGTIVGSAVFNLLFVIGMCAVVSAKVLTLTWWPLFRDVSCYSISLIVLIWVFHDQEIYWYEALVLSLLYIAYVIFMKYNSSVEAFVKRITKTNRVNSDFRQSASTNNLIGSEMCDRPPGIPTLKAGNGKFRHGVLQLMIHTIDPLGEAKVHDKALKLQAIASLKVIMNNDNHNNIHQRDLQNHTPAGRTNGTIASISNGIVMQQCPGGGEPGYCDRNYSQQTTMTTVGSMAELPAPDVGVDPMQAGNLALSRQSTASHSSTGAPTSASPQQDLEADVRDQQVKSPDPVSPEPLDLSWPDSWRRRITYVLVAPIMFPLWVTLPDVRRQDRRCWFVVTFIGSIVWIGGYSYLMNWFAAVAGYTIGIPPPVMGLTVLAAGTSIPDLITSVIVAKKGYGDMAISSSVGSNIFDVTIGLPVPWLLYGMIYGKPYKVNSTGLFCAICLLFLMLLGVIASIAAFKWKMNKSLGFFMFGLYILFITLSLLIEYHIIVCPINI